MGCRGRGQKCWLSSFRVRDGSVNSVGIVPGILVLRASSLSQREVVVVSAMSSQKGNVARSRPQRHQNTFSFKNDKFDKSVQTKVGTCLLH